jgi:hypothetical protein
VNGEEAGRGFVERASRAICANHRKQFYYSFGIALVRLGVIREGERFTLESGAIGIA